LTWTAIKNNPVVIWVLLLIAIPYGINLGIRIMILQTNILARPPVGRRDERQVLILGSMLSFGGTSKNAKNRYDNNIANTLRREFGLEIGYEDSDSSWNFVRDGTVSWIHGMRYFERTNESENESEKPNDIGSSFDQRVRHLCRLKWVLTHESRDRYGFEPTVFGSDSEFNHCSIFNPDSRRCQLPVCEESVKKEYGCALRRLDGGDNNDGNDDDGNNTGGKQSSLVSNSKQQNSCDMMPFKTTLLQTRQPWHVVRSLVERYCWRKKTIQESMPSSLEDLLSTLGMVPQLDGDDHCVNQFIDYVAGYYNTVLDNSADDDVKTYKIEETSPCEIAELSGFFDGPEATTTRTKAVVYSPNYEKVRRKCAAILKENNFESGTTTNGAVAGPIAGSEVEEDLEMLSVKRDLLPHASPEHIKRMKELFARLEYEYSAE